MIRGGIELDSQLVREFCHRWKIVEFSVFGSILREDFRPDSDVDVLVEYEKDAEWSLFDVMQMRDELGEILGRNVDLLDRAGVETSQNRFLKREVLSTLERVHAAR
jgi:uncharacterized protein